MTTTVMRDSVVGDAWIQEMCKLNPVQRVVGADGKPNGNILTGPVRLTFIDSLFEAKPQMKNDPNSQLKHSATILFTPYSDLTIFWEEYYRVAAAEFPEYWNADMGQYVGLDNPLFNAGLKSKHPGFTPNCYAMNSSSNYPPPVVDMQGNPVVDKARVQPGCWAIVAVNPYSSGKKFPRKGPRFGLQSVMIVGPDTVLRSGGAVNAKEQFKGVNVRPPVGVPNAGFGAVQTPPQGGGVATFYPPGAPGAGPGGFAQPVYPPAPAGMVPQASGPMPPMSGVPDDEDISSLA